jgi:hypothetical protein
MANDKFSVHAEEDHVEKGVWRVIIVPNGINGTVIPVRFTDEDQANRLATRLYMDLKPHADAEHDYYMDLIKEQS